MSIFKIQITAGKPAVFNPNPLTVYVNDSVYWFNGEEETPDYRDCRPQDLPHE